MPEPAPTDDLHAPDARAGGDSDARVEQLLLAGLDHYFAGRYEQAVHVWTRVLFVDRGHARARAYIERARAAIAERQRQSEELLHRGTAAFERGHTGAARRLLTAAVDHGAASEVALAYLERLDRLEVVRAAEPAPPVAVRAAAPPIRGVRSPRRLVGLALWIAALGAVIAVGIWLAGVVANQSRPGAASVVPGEGRAEPLPLVRASDVALVRARALFETGRAGDAIRVLATIPIADPNRAEADRLLADVQRTLLAIDGADRDGLSPVP